MKVYIEEQYKVLKMQLEDKGYEVGENVVESDYDIIICDIKNGGLKKMVNEPSLKKDGILIIDIGSKTINDIEKLINNKISMCLI